jgi:NADPH:quinone reductase-like Zn-dependent oxidoreductase
LYSAVPGKSLIKLDPAEAPLSTALGALGMPGLTAYVGLSEIGRPRAGETVVVSAASGAGGAVAGQLAKRAGARVVGIAGGIDKCRSVETELGARRLRRPSHCRSRRSTRPGLPKRHRRLSRECRGRCSRRCFRGSTNSGG